jgi:glutamate 5-kinase
MEKYKRIVIKIGTAVIADKTGKINPAVLKHLIDQIITFQKSGKEIILVSSGAVGAGRKFLDLKKEKSDILRRQTLAALGQAYLMKEYIDLFGKKNILVAQALLMRSDFVDRQRYLNAIGTLNRLIKEKIIPIINENDVVATEELGFGDNDGLAAMTAVALKADLLLILSKIKGLYTANPEEDKKAKIIDEVRGVSDELFKLCQDKKAKISFGGMLSKLKAARVATRAGVAAVIASGSEKNIIADVLAGKKAGTKFLPGAKKEKERNKWLLAGLTSSGSITVDDGAKNALLCRKSLLPVGLEQIKNDFKKGSLIEILDEAGRCFAAGIVRHNSEEIKKMLRLKKEKRIQELKKEFKDELIHSNDIIIL